MKKIAALTLTFETLLRKIMCIDNTEIQRKKSSVYDCTVEDVEYVI